MAIRCLGGWIARNIIYWNLINIYCLMMKLNILLLLALTLSTLHAEDTVLTYIIEHEIDQSDQYVELQLKVQTAGKSLSGAIADAARVIKKIQEILKAYCLQDSKNKKDCEDIVDATKYVVEPKYHLVRKIETFTLFIVTHDVTVSIRSLKGLGKMVDEIIREGEGLITLTNFAWKADDELDPERETLREGIQEGKELCGRLGKVLSQFISVTELEVPEEVEGAEDQERDEDLAEEEIEVTIFKFKVKCSDKAKKK